MSRPEKIVYTTKVHTTGGRIGSSRSDDGRLDVKLSRPGTSGAGTNPEQLFAAGWSACYESAMELAVRRMKVALPADFAVDAEVHLGPNGPGFDVAVRLTVSLPGIAPDVAQRLIDATHEVCPYSIGQYEHSDGHDRRNGFKNAGRGFAEISGAAYVSPDTR
jgi:lipoyl-dependent peroxiredoxin